MLSCDVVSCIAKTLNVHQNYSTTEDTLQYTNKYELCVEMSMVLGVSPNLFTTHMLGMLMFICCAETLNLFLQKMQLHELFAHDIAQVMKC